MIASLRGRLVSRSPDEVILDVGGVGYLVHVSLASFHALPPLGEEARVDVHTYVREDQISLYGFAVPGEKALFLELCEVSGIGPRLALTILSGVTPQDLVGAVLGENAARLQKVPGVGKKLAARLIVELKDRLTRRPMDLPAPAPLADASPAAGVKDDLVLALTALGYRPVEIDRAVRLALKGGDRPVEELLKVALRELSPPTGKA